MLNIGKRYRWTYLQGRNRDADIENGLTDMKWGGEPGRMERAANIWRCIHHHV